MKLGIPLLVLTLLATTTLTASAGEIPCGAGCVPCPKKICVTVGCPTTIEKKCWKVECEEVCIPAIRWPWEYWRARKSNCCTSGPCAGGCGCCLPPKCGRVITVRRLKSDKYECDACEYEHHIQYLNPPCCDKECTN